jgi:hypothetical protein
MKSDLSRGFQPDRTRGKSYRRVLLQQGRLLLDSDVAALGDAMDGQIRDLARSTTSLAGSPDLGFLITPGRLLKVFTGPEDVPAATGVDAWLDHARRYLDRFPSLYIGATESPGSVTLDLRPLAGASVPAKIRIWVRADAAHSVTFRMPDPDWASPRSWTRAVVNQSAWQVVELDDLPETLGQLRIEYASASTVCRLWIGLIEALEGNGTGNLSFWAAAGHFHLDGLQLALAADTPYPQVGYGAGPAPALPSSPAGYLAYLEAWERSITAVEDPGVLENALGSAVDTCTRTVNVAQVKLLALSSAPLPEPSEIHQAFAAIDRGGGLLTVSPIPTTQSVDPCQIPEGTSYLGEDNRLYRFEVHQGGDLEDVVIKWSRNNGAELVAAASADGDTITFPPDARLQDADLVEVLIEGQVNGTVVSDDLLDRQAAAITDDRFVPPVRKVGQLFYLSGKTSEATAVQFKLQPRLQSDPLPALQSGTTYKVRRWDGIIDLAEIDEDTLSTDIEDGIRVTFGTVDTDNALDQPGSDYRAGDYWLYEARAVTPNDNGPWRATRHGPERLFAPLAIFTPDANTEKPLVLTSWLDERYARLGELEADDIAYDGAKVDSPAATVQEALDELFARREDGCCYVDLDPAADPINDDAALRIRELIDERLDGRGVICLRPGLYYLKSQISLVGIQLELRGCPDAVLVADITGQAPLVVGTDSSLVLSEVVLTTVNTGGCPALVDVNGQGAFQARQCGLFNLGPAWPQAVLRTDGTVPEDTFNDPAYIVTLPSTPPPASGPLIQLDDCVLLGGWGLAAGNLRGLRMRDTVAYCRSGVVHAAGEVHNLDVSGSVLATGFDESHFIQLRATLPAELEAAVTALLESPSLQLTGDGEPFYARELYDARVSECSFHGYLAFHAGLVFSTDLHGNHHDCGSAIRIDNAVQSSVQSEYMVVRWSAVYTPQAALSFTIADCIIRFSSSESYSTAFFIADSSSEGKFQDVRVSGNRIHSARTGIQVRWWEASSGSHEDRIVVENNYIELGAFSYVAGMRIHLRGGAITNHVEIRNNQIYTLDDSPKYFSGIAIVGAGCTVMDNHIRSTSVYDENSWIWAHAIYSAESPGIMIAGNLIDLIYFYGSSISLIKCNHATLSHNITRLQGYSITDENGYVYFSCPFSFDMHACDWAVVQGNVDSLDGYYSSFRGCNNIFISGNIFKGEMSCGGTWVYDENTGEDTEVPTENGIISDNVVHISSTGYGWLGIYSVIGSWQLSNNRSSGTINIFSYLLSDGAGGWIEAEYHAQVQGNQTNGGMWIGSGWPPSPSTTLQVIGNRITHWLDIYSNYLKLLILGNMAGAYYKPGTPSIGATPPPVMTSNVDL